MSNEPSKIKRRGDDGHRVFSVCLKEETVSALDRIAGENNYSRNELINIMLEYGVKTFRSRNNKRGCLTIKVRQPLNRCIDNLAYSTRLGAV